jgi:uncharacterized OB-fold protein
MMDFPLPNFAHESLKPFWDAAASRKLVFPRCTACGAFCWYPRPNCPECGGADFTWTEIGGVARLFSWAVVRRALHAPLKPIVPYVPVILEFDDAPGVRLVTRWIGGDIGGLTIGQEVRITFDDLGCPGIHTDILAPLCS